MGLYTRLQVHAELHNLTGDAVYGLIWMCDPFSKPGHDSLLPYHKFFKQDRAHSLFHMDRKFPPEFTKISETTWILRTNAAIKNYEGEIEMFIDWIKPFVKKPLLSDKYFAQSIQEGSGITINFSLEDE